MRIGFISIFTLTMLVYSLSQVFVIAEHYLNIEYIANNLCENKEAPELQCNGKCHLKKELVKDEKRKSNDSKTRIVQEIFLFQNEGFEWEQETFIPSEEENSSFYYQRNILKGISPTILQPPISFV